MRPRLLMCSAASFDLILVVMTESFTKAAGCERSVSASSAASAMTGADRLAMTRRVVTILDFMAVPCEWLEAHSMRVCSISSVCQRTDTFRSRMQIHSHLGLAAIVVSTSIGQSYRPSNQPLVGERICG